MVFNLNSELNYIYLLIDSFDIVEIWNWHDDNQTSALYDFMQYNLKAGILSIKDSINHMFEESITVYAAVLRYFFEAKILISGRLVNLIFVVACPVIFKPNAFRGNESLISGVSIKRARLPDEQVVRIL